MFNKERNKTRKGEEKMEKKGLNIEIKETGKGMPQRLREFLETEIVREEFICSNSNSLEKEIKRILTWMASVKEQGNYLFATLERIGDCTIMHVPGGRKEFRSHKNMDDVKEALEYIAANICGEGCTLIRLDVSRMNAVKVAYTVNIQFKM